MKFKKFKLVNLDKTVVCPTCQNDTFYKRKILLNTRGMTYFDLEAFNKTATALKCQKCGRYQWFDKTVANLTKYSKISSKRRSSKRRRSSKKRKTKKK